MCVRVARKGYLKQTDVVGDSADEADGLVLLALGHASELRDRHGGAVGLRHKQALQHDRVEAGVGPVVLGDGG